MSPILIAIGLALSHFAAFFFGMLAMGCFASAGRADHDRGYYDD